MARSVAPTPASPEISLKRQVSRDGTSAYFINAGGRCRRKDITNLFLGTGLGSRSYAIIEQGMISRVIDARAEDMRAFVEEAAGISRYKERRKETEARIADTWARTSSDCRMCAMRSRSRSVTCSARRPRPGVTRD